MDDQSDDDAELASQLHDENTARENLLPETFAYPLQTDPEENCYAGYCSIQ